MRGAYLSFGLAFLIGLYLVVRGGWPILAIGLTSLLAGFAYTGGPKPIAYSASGELFVFLFFGLAAVTGSYYLQSQQWSWNALLLGAAVGATAWGLKLGYVYPGDVFVVHYTIECIVVVLLGGAGTLMGPVVGGLIYGLSKYWLAVVLPGFQLLVFAPIIIVIIVAFPEGIVGLLKKKREGSAWGSYIE